MRDIVKNTFGKYPVWVHFEGEKKGGVSFANKAREIEISIGKENKVSKIIAWGDNNQLGDDREELIEKNNIIPQLLLTKRNIMIASGLFHYKNELVEGKRKVYEQDIEVVAEASRKLERKDFWERVGNDFIKHSLAYALYQKQANGKWSMEYIKARYIRPEKMNDNGIIENYYRCGDWSKKENIKRIASYEYYEEAKTKPNSFIRKVSDDFLGNEYFPIPVWFSGSEWIESGNKIPKYWNEFLKNANFSPLHVSVPKNYFYDEAGVKMGKIKEADARKKEAEKLKAFLESIDKVLAGVQNAGKTIWSEYFISQMEKEYGGIKFTELKTGKTNEGILKLYEKTTDALVSGTGVHPSLAAIITAGGLSSGSEIRNALDMFIITQIVSLRKQILKFADLLNDLNGWDKKLKFGFRDVQLTTTDKNPTGSQNVIAD